MYIRTDENNNVVELIFVGVMPEHNGYEINEIDEEILNNILDYKYIDGEFIKNTEDIYQKNIDMIREIKIRQMSKICNTIIENGIDIDGYHYSLRQTDQIELIKLESMIEMNPETKIFYHADGEKCRNYPIEEFLKISGKALGWITYHRTYFNLLKSEINNMTDVYDILDVKYGMPLNTEDKKMLDDITNNELIDITPVDDPFDYGSLFPKIDINSLPRYTDTEYSFDGDINYENPEIHV